MQDASDTDGRPPEEPLRRAVDDLLRAGPPGAHVSVRAPGTALDHCAGLAQVFGDDGPLARPLRPDAAHDLGSVTKVAATTACLAALVSAGEVTLDAPLARYLPGPCPEASLDELLTHRAGLWEWWPTYLQASGAEEALALVARLPLRYPPRSGRHYSDLGFMLLGEVVRQVCSAELPEAFAALVAEPLSLTGFRYAGPVAGSTVAEPVASSAGDRIERQMVASGRPYPVPVDGAAFGGWRTRVLVGEVNDGNAFHSFGGAAGHAGLFGDVSSLHRLGRALLDSARGHGPWSALPAFWAPSEEPDQLRGFRRWADRVGDCAADVIGHTGFPGIGFAVLPAHDATVVLCTNRLHVPPSQGEPAPFAPMWQRALHAAHAAVHLAEGASAGRDR